MSTNQRSQQRAGGREERPRCKDFASNFSTKGDACPFSHERNAKADMVCRYYLAGNCAFGSRCR